MKTITGLKIGLGVVGLSCAEIMSAGFQDFEGEVEGAARRVNLSG